MNKVGRRIARDPIRALMRAHKRVQIRGQARWPGQIELWDAGALLGPTLEQAMADLQDQMYYLSYATVLDAPSTDTTIAGTFADRAIRHPR